MTAGWKLLIPDLLVRKGKEIAAKTPRELPAEKPALIGVNTQSAKDVYKARIERYEEGHDSGQVLPAPESRSAASFPVYELYYIFGEES